MSKYSSKNVWRSILGGTLIFLCIVLYAMGAALHRDTLVDWWIPAAVALILALASGATMWRIWIRLTDSSKFIVNYICHTIFFCGLFIAAIYGINRAFPRQSSIRETEAVVERKYTQTRHHRQRVSRRVYKQGAPYKVYYIGLELPDGRRKDMQVTASRYNRIRSGSTIPLTLQKGFFGMTIILKNTSKKNTTL